MASSSSSQTTTQQRLDDGEPTRMWLWTSRKNKSVAFGFIALYAAVYLVVMQSTLTQTYFDSSSSSSSSLPSSSSSIRNNNERLCSEFFTMLGPTTHGGYIEEYSCRKADFNLPEDSTFPNLGIQNSIMKAIGSKLTVFLACNPFYWNETTASEFNANFNYTHVSFRPFDRDTLFSKFGFERKHVTMMHQMNAHPASFSDIFRLLLAAEHKMAYIDSDMFLLTNDLNLFLNQPTVAAPVWNDFGAGLEIQNSGFCLPQHALEATMQTIRDIMESKTRGQKYGYTELGPHAMQRSIGEWGPVLVLPTLHPEETNIERLVLQIEKYNVKWIHLCGNHRRRRNPEDLYHQMTAAIIARNKTLTPPAFI